MSFFNRLLGAGIEGTANSVRNVAEVFVGNRRDRELGMHMESMAARDQYAAEFQYQGTRSWFDSLIDGLNRLPRPLITFFVLGAFPGCLWMIFYHPKEFQLLVEALAIIPNGLWGLFSLVIGFYFAGRMQIKSRDFAVNNAAIERFSQTSKEYRYLQIERENLMQEIESQPNQTLSEFDELRRAPDL